VQAPYQLIMFWIFFFGWIPNKLRKSPMFAAWRLVPVSRYIYVCVCVMHVCVYLCTHIYIHILFMYYYVISRVSWITVVHLQLRWTNPPSGLNHPPVDMASAHTCWWNPPIYDVFPIGKVPKITEKLINWAASRGSRWSTRTKTYLATFRWGLGE